MNARRRRRSPNSSQLELQNMFGTREHLVANKSGQNKSLDPIFSCSKTGPGERSRSAFVLNIYMVVRRCGVVSRTSREVFGAIQKNIYICEPSTLTEPI